MKIRWKCEMFLGKEVRVKLKGQAQDAYIELKKREDKEAQILLHSIHRMIDILKQNPQFGDPIRKQLIPPKFKEMEIQNLYRVELSNYWRMLYTLEGTQVEIFCFVLSIMDHKEYDKLFGYKKF
ncbi:MAG TPA: hypothetical protein VJI32_01300 [Candidatus Nanoarchaeia archaeon]|nr:hypothetical protein [Candidatus Nanoarchaeia archaeon]